MKNGKKHILLIDDEVDIVVILEDILTAANYIVTSFETGKAAIDYTLANDDVDLIITDINIPDCSGIDVYQRIKKENKSVKFIFMSGYDESGQVPIGPLLVKPFHDTELLKIIKDKLND